MPVLKLVLYFNAFQKIFGRGMEYCVIIYLKEFGSNISVPQAVRVVLVSQWTENCEVPGLNPVMGTGISFEKIYGHKICLLNQVSLGTVKDIVKMLVSEPLYISWECCC